jgi:hypothetical protein
LDAVFCRFNAKKNLEEDGRLLDTFEPGVRTIHSTRCIRHLVSGAG